MVYAALKRLTKHSAIYALGPAVQKLLGFLLLPFITAYIGSTDNYGVLEISAVSIAVMGQVLGINLLYGMSRFYNEYERPEERAQLVSTTLLLLGGSTGIALALAWLFRETGARILFGSASYSPAFVAVFVILFFQTVGQVGLRWLQILEKSVTYGVLTTIKLVCEIGLKVWLMLAGLMYMGALYSVVGCEAVIGVGLFAAIAIKLGLSFSPVMARRLWRYSAPLILSGLCMFVLQRADRFFVQHFHGEGEVGLYSLSCKLGAIGNTVLLESFGLIWFPYVFALKSEDEVRLLCRKVLTYLNLLMCAVSLFLAVFSREIVNLMSHAEFHDAWRAMPIVAAGYVLWVLFQIVQTVFFVRERTGLVTWLLAGAAVLNLALNFVLVREFGYVGAAWATVATFAALAVASWIVAERIFPIDYEVGRVVAPIVLGVALYFASLAIPGEWPTWVVIAVKSFAVALLPLGLLAAGYLHGEEKAKIKEIWRSLRSRGGRGSH